MEGAVPPSWEKHWEGPEEPVAYRKAVVARMLAVNAMLDRRRDPGGLRRDPRDSTPFSTPRRSSTRCGSSPPARRASPSTRSRSSPRGTPTTESCAEGAWWRACDCKAPF